jgi:hypothetical protein
MSHATSASVLGMDTGRAFQRGRGGPGGWWIVDEPELHLGQDILVPDLAGWRLLAGSYGGLGSVRVEPFDAIELELDALWPSSVAGEQR